MGGLSPCVRALLLLAASLQGSVAFVRGGAMATSAAALAARELRLRGGMADDTAAQMAEIRAMRARQYEQQKSAHSAEAAEIAAEEASYVGAQKVWALATDKLSAHTIQPKVPMSKGDARSFYLETGVTLLRNRNTGMVIELLHESSGWFQFVAREGAPLQQMSATGNVVPMQRFYAAGLLEDIKGNPLKTSFVRSKGVTAGPWSLSMKGTSLVLSHTADPTREIHLLEDGFVYLNKASGEGIHIESSGSPAYMPIEEAQTIVTSLAT